MVLTVSESLRREKVVLPQGSWRCRRGKEGEESYEGACSIRTNWDML